MPEPGITPMLVLIVVLALAFDFINGFHDSANAIATTVLTRALSMRNAVLLAAAQNFLGALIWEGVAKSIAEGIIAPEVAHTIPAVVILSAILGAILWNLLTWYLGLPSSSSHALIGGVIGATVAYQPHVVKALNVKGLEKIITALVLSPILGMICGAILMVLLMRAFANLPPARINGWFRWLQIVSANFMAFSHGTNDAQKSMGIITLALYSGGVIHSVHVPIWVKVLAASAMALGTAGGGWRIIKTVGRKIMGLQPVHGFASETAAAGVILGATLLHAPVSTTHVISSAIMGVGASRRLSSVRWGVVAQIVLAWVFTLPASALLSASCYLVLGRLLRL
ncbi:MAG TPA: anion permease [Armatimonadota bacterium]|jgi:PiT family inorganic phosphate transporter